MDQSRSRGHRRAERWSGGTCRGYAMTRVTRSKRGRARAGVSLTELLCVLAILALLASLYLGAILRAYVKIMAFIKTLQ